MSACYEEEGKEMAHVMETERVGEEENGRKTREGERINAEQRKREKRRHNSLSFPAVRSFGSPSFCLSLSLFFASMSLTHSL